jgi:CubicO group peptidase (beta-lactamase class C family)
MMFTSSLHVSGYPHENTADAASSDPVAMGWMQGSPPPAAAQVRWDNGSMWRFPQYRWGFSHMRDLVPSASIGRAGPVSELPRALRDDLDAVPLTTLAGQTMCWREALAATYTDAIMVLHHGRVVYERWFGVTRPDTQHILFSVTKSFVGLIAEMLIEAEMLRNDTKAGDHVPELKGSGLGNATVRQILDMRTGLAFSEDYVAGQQGLSDVQRMSIAGAWMPRPAGYHGPDGHFAFVASLGLNVPHGGEFVYRTPNTTALQWLVERVSGLPLAALIRDWFWQPMGMEVDAAIAVDRLGTAFGGGGLMACLGDIARVGEMMRLGGRWNGRQIVPEAVVARVFRGGDPAAFAPVNYPGNPDGSYASQWWHRAGGQAMALGVHGQGIYIDRAAGVVIARLGSHPVASNRGNMGVTVPAYDALVAAL